MATTTTYHNKTVILKQPLSTHDSIGLAVGAEAALLSLTAVIIVLALVCRNVWNKTLYPPPSATKQYLIRVPADLFMLSLFIAELFHSLGGVMHIKWLHDEVVYVGHYCNAQGAIQQIGEPAVALVTLVIAVHTFSTVWWQKGVKSLLVASIIMGVVWLFVILYASIALGRLHNTFYVTPTYWCWIGPNYMAEKITAEYLWFWLTLGLSFVFYVLLFFWSMGNITVHQHKWWKFSVHRSNDSFEDSERRRLSLKLIAYPITYTFVVIPLSAVRWREFAGKTVPNGAVYFSESLFRLSGLFNVLLFLQRCRGLLLFGTNPSVGRRLGALDAGKVDAIPSTSSTNTE